MSENLSSKFKGDSIISAAGRITGLPRGYGDTKIVIMPRDPMWFYAYWEVSSVAHSELRKKIGDDKYGSSCWVLRVYDITDKEFDGSNANKFFDIALNQDSESWYINVTETNRVWCVDIGVVTPDGRFIAVARSNVLALPRHGVSTITDEQWAMLQQEFEKLLKLSGVDKIGRSSFDLTKLMRERWEEILSVSMPSSHMGASSWKKAPGGEVKAKDC